MDKHRFYFFWLILFFGLAIKILPLLGNNFYFTMDQGRDAVYTREIINRQQIILEGPETSGIKGFFTGPLWYYFISLGFFLFRGHPLGAVFTLILLNTTVTGILMWWLAKRGSPSLALLIGFSLQFFWPFYDSSRYGFNPFLLVPLAILLILLLTDSLGGKKHSFLLAAIPVGLAFHSEVAGAIVFFFLYFLTGLYLTIRRKISLRTIFLTITLVLVFFLPHLISEINSGFPQTNTLLWELGNSQGVLSGTNFRFIAQKFLELLKESIIPQSALLSLVFLAVVTFSLIRSCRRHVSTYHVSLITSHPSLIPYRFPFLTLLLWLLSWLWFGSNKGWQAWHTVYLPPILFISIMLVLSTLPRKISLPIFLILFVSQFFFFKYQYFKYLSPSDDPSLLKNELTAIDWVYQKSNGKGFYVYNYLPSVLDYPYQYLFWWYGRNKYDYLPCEFSSYPGSPKLFVPGNKYYENPKRECTNLRFLIIEPDKNIVVQNEWLTSISQNTYLIGETKIGQISIEMRSYEFTQQE